MTVSEFDISRLDDILRMFDGLNNGGTVERSVLFSADAPDCWRLAVEHLVEEGYLKECGDSFEITYKGKSFIHDGGFCCKHRTERVLLYCSVIAAVSGVVSLVVSVVALLCQLCD